MRLIIISALILLHSVLFAQESQLVIDSVETKSGKNIELYIAPGYMISKFVETTASFANIYMGFVLYDRVDVNVSYGIILNNFKKQLIFPAYHQYNQKDISILLQYNLTDGKVRPSIGMGYRFTQAYWEPENESNDTFRDDINQFEFYGGLNYSVLKGMMVELHVGYKLAKDVELISFASDSYDGLFFRAMVKARLFK